MTFHVLTAEFIHESNTFKKGETGLRAFAADTLHEGQAAIERRGAANTELAGFLDVAGEQGWQISHAISAHATPGARVSRAAFDHIAGRICALAEAQKDRLDGVLLGLHGSMVPDFTDDGEGELLTRLRAILGPDLPIAVSLDLHAMVSPRMVELAQIYVSFKTYPHIDMRVAGAHAARLLHGAMAGQTRPATTRAHVPMLDEANGGRSDVPASAALYTAATRHEAEPGILAVSVNAGFAEADTTIVGPTVLVTHDRAVEGAAARATQIASDLADQIWNGRHSVANEFLTVDAAADFAKHFDPVNQLVAASIYMAYWFPHVPGALWVLAFAVLLLYVNSRSVGRLGAIEYWLVMIEVVAVAVFVGLGVLVLAGLTGAPAVGLANITGHGGFMPFGASGIWLGCCFVIYSFIGVEIVAVTSGEASDPARTIPAAMRRMVFGLSAIYIVTISLLVALVPWSELGVGESPFVRVLGDLGIPGAAGLMNFWHRRRRPRNRNRCRDPNPKNCKQGFRRWRSPAR